MAVAVVVGFAGFLAALFIDRVDGSSSVTSAYTKFKVILRDLLQVCWPSQGLQTLFSIALWGVECQVGYMYLPCNGSH